MGRRRAHFLGRPGAPTWLHLAMVAQDTVETRLAGHTRDALTTTAVDAVKLGPAAARTDFNTRIRGYIRT